MCVHLYVYIQIYEGGEEERAMGKNKKKQMKHACSLSQVKLSYMHENRGNKKETICRESPLVRGDR